MVRWNANGSLLAAVLAALGASLCCLGPLLLLTLGIGGSWLSRLTRLEPFRPFFIAAAVLFMALAFRKIYHAPGSCEAGSSCSQGTFRRQQRLLFWAVALIAFGLLSGPWLVPLIYS